MNTATESAPAGNAAGPASALRVGVVGVGRIGRMHTELLARRVPGATVAAIHDAHAPSAQAVGADLGVPVAGSADELVSSPDVDAVAICTSTPTHADLIVAAAGAGKAVFCEKPVSLDLEEVDRALRAVAGAAVPFQVGFNRRFDPAHASVRAAVAAGEVGDPHLVRISSRDPAPPPIGYIRESGGIFLDMTIHDFDMARFVTGAEVVEVFARGAVRVDPGIGEAGDIDTAVIVLTHEDGCITAIDNSRRAAYGYDQRVEVFGSRGVASSENPPAHSGVVRTVEGTREAALPYFYLERYTASYVREWEAFVAALSAGDRPPVTTGDARAPMVIGLAARRSFEERRPVRIEEVDA
jgi:myo-inositol 2-dehydrogenase / D-chiro-inositol 1-dehydrogenase